jgi:hypothetical protein
MKPIPKLPSPRTLIDVLIFLFCLTFSTWLMFHTFTYVQGDFKIASKLWSDFAAHIPLIRSFSLGQNFPPEYPTFPGEPIRYHYLFYLLAGCLESLGLNLPLALNLISTFGFTLLLWLIYLHTRIIFHSRLAGGLSLLLFLFNGTLSWVVYFTKSGWTLAALLDIPRQVHFASFGPWNGQIVSAFWNLNIYTNQRHLGLSFALALLVLYPFLVRLFLKRQLSYVYYPILFAIMLLLPTLHQVAFVCIWIIAVSISFLNLSQVKYYLPLVLALALGSIPGILIAPHTAAGVLAFEPGFLAQNKTFLGILRYWWWNLGIYLPLIPILFFWVKRPGKIFLLSLIPLFILANLFRLSPDMINNHKLINFFMIGVVVLTAGFLRALFHQTIYVKLFAFALLTTLTFSGFLDFPPIVNDYYLTVDDLPQNPMALWIKNHTPPQSVVLTTTYLYNPAGLAGRKTFEDYGYFNWSMGYNDSLRRLQLNYLFSPTLPLSTICRYLAVNQINYVLISPGKGDLGSIDPQISTIVRVTTPVYESPSGERLYAVTDSCR